MCQALKRARSQYTPPNSSTISGKLLDDLNDGAAEARAEAVKVDPDAQKGGRTVTGDAATLIGHPLIGLLVHVPGKGVQLLDIINCTGHMAAGGTKDALYIAE